MADTSFKNLPFYSETEFVNLLPNLQKKTEISKKKLIARSAILSLFKR